MHQHRANPREPGQRHQYRPDIDGLRAVAIVPVILFHAGLGCRGGFVGVDIFFVISGFLISSLILNEINDGSFSLARFWERRIRRILPALIPVVLATLVAGWFLYLPKDFQLLGSSVLAQTGLVSNFFFWLHTGYFDPSSDTMPLLHTWSLAVEEQFYLLFPLLLVFLARHKRLPLPRIILCLCLVSFELSVLGSAINPQANFYLLPTRAWELMIGAWLATRPAKQFAHPALNEAAGLSGLGLIIFSLFYYTRETVFPGWAAIPPCLGAALIIFSGSSGSAANVVSRALSFRPVIFIGLISYSLYLWHWPLLVFTKYVSIEKQSWQVRVALVSASVVLAILSWKLVETPFRKRLFCPGRPQVFAFAGCSMLLLLMLGSGVYLQHGITSRLTVRALSYQNNPFDDRTFWKDSWPDEAAAGQFAELGGQSTNRPAELLLWGDSHAMAVASVLDKLCRKFSVRGLQATHAITAPILGYNQTRGLGLKSIAFSQSVVDFVARKRIKTVIIAANWSMYRPPEVINAKLAATVQALKASGAQVYILKDVPKADFDVPRFATLTALHHGNLQNLGISPAKYQADNGDYDAIFNHAAQMGAAILDTPKCFLNRDGRYDVIRNEKLLYIDDSHLTAEGAELLYPMFEPLFSNR